MSATVMFTLARVDDVIAAPLNAVFSTAESARYVFLRKGETFEAHAVETGIADTRYVQIVSGLQVGDELARNRPLEYEGELPVGTVQQPPPKARSKSSREADLMAPLPSGSSGGPKPKSGGKPNRT
jgi:hypothetical protein